jgi:hypothetical protein
VWIAAHRHPQRVIGSRLLFLIEEWDRFVADPRPAPGGGNLISQPTKIVLPSAFSPLQ